MHPSSCRGYYAYSGGILDRVLDDDADCEDMDVSYFHDSIRGEKFPRQVATPAPLLASRG